LICASSLHASINNLLQKRKDAFPAKTPKTTTLKSAKDSYSSVLKVIARAPAPIKWPPQQAPVVQVQLILNTMAPKAAPKSPKATKKAKCKILILNLICLLAGLSLYFLL
jgi:hypothetical protein